MRKKDGARSAFRQLAQRAGAVLVVEVPPLAENPLLEPLGIRPAANHVHIVIGLQHQRLTAGNRAHPRLADVPDVRRHAAAQPLTVKGEPDGIGRIVRNRERMEETLSGGKSADKIRSDMTICEDPVHAGILECGVYFRADATVAELQDEMDQLTDGYFKLTGCSFGTDIVYSGEFTRKGVNKATGMQHMMDAMGISREDTIAFGDGSNDFEMIDYAGQGIVMGNGIPALKEHADYVTTDIHQEGIWNGLKQVGVI